MPSSKGGFGRAALCRLARNFRPIFGIARNTVALAYQELVNEGFPRVGGAARFFVADDVMNDHATAPASPTPVRLPKHGSHDCGPARRRDRMRAAASPTGRGAASQSGRGAMSGPIAPESIRDLTQELSRP
jgi:hypothetical protein